MAIIFSPTSQATITPEELSLKIVNALPIHRPTYKRYIASSLVTDYHGYDTLHTAYLDAVRLNNLYFFSSFDEIITDELIQEISIDCGLLSIDENARKLQHLLCSASLAEINAQIDFLFLNLIANSYNYSYFQAAFSLCELTLTLFTKVYDLSLSSHTHKPIEEYYIIDEYVDHLKTIVKEIKDALHGKSLYSSRILTAIGFIKDNYNKDLSLKGISEYLNASPTALSTDFNKEVHCSISDYISQCRIKAASKLLITSCYTIAEIAQKVGFTSAKYFSQIFKEIIGIGPLQYRKHKSTQ